MRKSLAENKASVKGSGLKIGDFFELAAHLARKRILPFHQTLASWNLSLKVGLLMPASGHELSATT